MADLEKGETSCLLVALVLVAAYCLMRTLWILRPFSVVTITQMGVLPNVLE